MRRAGLRLIIALALARLEGTAFAEEGVYVAMAGGGVDVHVDSSSAPLSGGAILFKSVYGLTDRLNWDGPLIVTVGRDAAVMGGSGLEYVYFQTNHWRLNVAMGLALRIPSGPVGGGVYAESAVRWLMGWGWGASLELHGLAALQIIDPGAWQGFHLYPAIALHQEFW